MRRICQCHKFPKQADLFTSAHKNLCSLFFNFLASGCSNTMLNPLPLTSLSKIPPKARKVLPWQTLAGLPWGTKTFWLCLHVPILTKTMTAHGPSPSRILLPIPQHVDQVQSGFYYLHLSTWIKSSQDFTTCTSVILQPASWFMAVLLPFLLLQVHHSTTSPRNCSKHQDSSNAGVTRGGCNTTSSVPSPPWAGELPFQADHKGQHLCPCSLVSSTAFTSLIHPSESVLDWGGGEKSLC